MSASGFTMVRALLQSVRWARTTSAIHVASSARRGLTPRDEKTGRTYRLLTEAEWEYAARAASAEPYFWGRHAGHDRANYGADKCCTPFASASDQWLYTSPVGSFALTLTGFDDMSGDVLQWVQDCFAPSYAGLPDDGSAYERDEPLRTAGDLSDLNGTGSCSYRIVRGGSWGDPQEQIRSAFRSFAPFPPTTKLVDYRSGGVGFRVAADVSRHAAHDGSRDVNRIMLAVDSRGAWHRDYTELARHARKRRNPSTPLSRTEAST
jgi:formylglycine-generating enzyme required for sulfatase activity